MSLVVNGGGRANSFRSEKKKTLQPSLILVVLGFKSSSACESLLLEPCRKVAGCSQWLDSHDILQIFNINVGVTSSNATSVLLGVDISQIPQSGANHTDEGPCSHEFIRIDGEGASNMWLSLEDFRLQFPETDVAVLCSGELNDTFIKELSSSLYDHWVSLGQITSEILRSILFDAVSKAQEADKTDNTGTIQCFIPEQSKDLSTDLVASESEYTILASIVVLVSVVVGLICTNRIAGAFKSFCSRFRSANVPVAEELGLLSNSASG